MTLLPVARYYCAAAWDVGLRWRTNHSAANCATCSSFPGSANKCVAPGMILSSRAEAC